MDRRRGQPVRQRRDDALTRLGWERVELLLAGYYRGCGYQVEHTGTGRGGRRFDGGIDLKLRRGEEYILVECKHWNAWQVPHNAVHQLLGIMVNEGATGAIVVSSGEFTDAARAAAGRQRHVQLVEGDELRQMLGPIVENEPALHAGAQYAPFAAEARDRLVRPAIGRTSHLTARRLAFAAGALALLLGAS